MNKELVNLEAKPMILEEYLFIHRKKTSRNELANLIGISKGHLMRIVKGQCRPSPTSAAKIEVATNGQVTRTEALYPEDYEGKIFEHYLSEN